MKKNLLIILCFAALGIQAQNVPNGGFENWSSGVPDNWYANNIPTIATPITQATPAYSGSLAVKGEVVTTVSGNLPPILQSTDMLGNGFAVGQAYSTLSFYYKTNLTGAHVFNVLVGMTDAGSSPVGIGAMMYSGTVTSYTLATIPIAYIGSNPVECVITFTVSDSTGATVTPGNYFIVDEVGLSGLASVDELTAPALNIESVYPNPATHSVSVRYALDSKSDVEFILLSMQGATVRKVLLPETASGKHEMKLDAANIPAGLYILRMKTNKGITFNRVQVAR